MKRTHSASQGIKGKWLTVCSSAVISIFLLQSCCLLPGAQEGARRPCNCAGEKPAYAAMEKKSSPYSDALPAASAVNETEAVAPNAAVSLNVHDGIAVSDQQPGSVPAPLQAESLTLVHATTEERLAESPVMIRETAGLKKAEKKMPLGIKTISTEIIAGPNLSFKSSDEDLGGLDQQHKPGAGFQLGVKSVFGFSDKLGISAGLLLKTNKAKEVIRYSSPGEPGSGGSTTEYEGKYSYTYLSAPLLAEIKLNDQFTVMAGPEVNLLMAASVKESGYGSSDEKTDIKDNSVKTGIGVQAGVKYTIPNSPLAIQLVYDHRLSRLNEKSEEYYPGSSYESPAWNMKSIQLGVACSLCSLLKKK